MQVKTRTITRTDQGAEIGDVEIALTLSLDQVLCIASLLGHVGDREAGPLVGLYDAIGNALEYDKQGERVDYSLSRACDSKRAWLQTITERLHREIGARYA